MNQEQKLEVISTVYSDLNSIYSNPLKTKVAMVAQESNDTVLAKVVILKERNNYAVYNK